MDQTLSAIYEDGALRLLEPVDLAESSQVQVQILDPEGDLQTIAFKRLLMSIQHVVDNAENAGHEELVQTTFLRILRNDLHLLWQLSQEPQRELCSLLQLAVARLQPTQLAQAQLIAIRAALNLLGQPTLTEAEIRACHERLVASGLPPAFSLDKKAIQSYVDEL